MNKEDFLNELQESLVGEVSEQEIRDSIAYYRSYIIEEMQTGKSEEEVLRSLGSARLIARSIIDAKLDGREEAGHYYGEAEDAASEVSYDANNHREHPEVQERKNKMMRIIRTIVIGVLIVAAISAVLHIFVAILPLIIVLVIVGAIWKRMM